MQTQTTALDVLRNERPTLQAITSFNYGEGKDVSSIVLNEISYLEGMAVGKPEILLCELQSIMMAMKYVLKNNLSLDPNSGLVYTKTRNLALQKDQQGQVTKWGKVLEVQPTCEGLLSIAYQCGKILDHERPTVKKDAAGKVIEVSFKYLRPSHGSPRWVEITFDESDFKRWQTKSHAENSRGKQDAASKDYSNPNYRSFNGGIDPEFARAKAIRHSLKKLGTNPNERLSIAIKPAIVQTVDPTADIAATTEDLPTPEYHEFEETTAPTNAAPPTTVNVTTFEKFEIPSL